MAEPHLTIPVLVWADIDIGVAKIVADLNRIDGVRTHASCQGTIGEGGPEPYPARIMVSWENDNALDRIRRRYRLVIEGTNHGTVYPGPKVGRSPNG